MCSSPDCLNGLLGGMSPVQQAQVVVVETLDAHADTIYRQVLQLGDIVGMQVVGIAFYRDLLGIS